MNIPGQRFISARELAKQDVPYSAVLEACQNGTLNAHRLGPAFAIPEDVALRWVAEYKLKHDPNGVVPLRARIKELEEKVVALGGAL